MDLSYNQLSGPIPPSLGNLSSLRVLNLYFNELSGSIPESIGQLSMLENLYLSFNQLSGSMPESIGQLSMLENLYLSFNQLSGSIPESIGQLSMLENLHLYENQLSGSIPESIGLLTRLQELHLNDNQLSGNIPTSLGQLSNLRDLDVRNNSLVGVVSEVHFTKLNNLTDLFLYDNSLTLNMSPHWIPSFQLKYFHANSCKIGPQFPNWLQTSTDLQRLYLSNSGINIDRMPKWFEKISSHLVYLDLSSNQIGGNLPRIINNSGINDPAIGLQYVGAVGDDFKESFTICSVFEGKLFPVDGVLELETNLIGKWRVKAKEDSAGNWRLYGNGWRNFVEDNFTKRMVVVHIIRTTNKSLYVTGYDVAGKEINAVMGNGLKKEKCCVVGDDLPIIYQPMSIDFFRSYIDETLEEVCFLVSGTKYPSDISYSKDETLGVNVALAVWGEAWEILCKDYDFNKGHVMIIWNIEDDLFGGKMFHSRVNNIYGIVKICPEYIGDVNVDGIAVEDDVFDVVVTKITMKEGVIIPNHFMMRHRIRGHVAAKLRYKGRSFKMKINMWNNKDFVIFGDWIEFMNENGLVMLPAIEDGVEVKLRFHLHTDTINKEYAILFDVY